MGDAMRKPSWAELARDALLVLVMILLLSLLTTRKAEGQELIQDAIATSPDGNSLILHKDGTCANSAILKHIAKYRAQGATIPSMKYWKKASGHFDGKDYPEMCWYATASRLVVALFPDGDATIWSVERFRPLTGS